ncbi:LPXTG cell wall anchor domain-containing protein [Streptococcus merionis]|uniref:LPXTG cell wall anchor domain-containing protein n=1 Tax=Streptococcus merionis TaxID=400065 RepID=UPI003515600B
MEENPFIYLKAKSVARAYEDDLSSITVDPNSLNRYTTLEDLENLERNYRWGYSYVERGIPVLQQAVAGLVRVGETPNPQPNPNLQPPAVDKPLILRIVAVADEGVILDEYTITLNPGESKTVTAKEIPGYEVVGDKTRNLDYETIAGRDVGNYIGFMYRKVEEPNPSPNPDSNGDNNGSNPGDKPEDGNGDSQNPDGKKPDDGNSDQKPEAPDNGKKPEDGKKPDGDSNGKKPDGNSNGKDQTPPNNGGSNSGGNQTPPSKDNGSGSNSNAQTPPKTNGGAGANGNAQSGATNNAQNGNAASSGTGGSVKTTPKQSAGTGKTEAKSAANTAGGDRLPNTSSTGSLLSALGGILAGASLLSFRRKKEN